MYRWTTPSLGRGGPTISAKSAKPGGSIPPGFTLHGLADPWSEESTFLRLVSNPPQRSRLTIIETSDLESEKVRCLQHLQEP
jgi:hypothetical protein